MLFEFKDNNTNDYDYDINIDYFNLNNMVKQNNMQKSIDVNLENGFYLGNAFSKLYNPYKNYKPKKINAYSEQQKMLLRLQELDFLSYDLGLYLDTHPNDTRVFEVFKKINLEYNSLKKKYSEKYEVLELTYDNKNKYTWIDNPWPWDGGYYV